MSTPVVRRSPRLGLLRLAFERATADVHAGIADAHPGLRPAHIHTFRFGSIDGRRVTDLAAHAGMTKQSMQELVDHLDRHGYLRRVPDPVDRRARLVRLTERGRVLERDIHRAVEQVHSQWRSLLGRERYDALWDALRLLTGEPGG